MTGVIENKQHIALMSLFSNCSDDKQLIVEAICFDEMDAAFFRVVPPETFVSTLHYWLDSSAVLNHSFLEYINVKAPQIPFTQLCSLWREAFSSVAAEQHIYATPKIKVSVETPATLLRNIFNTPSTELSSEANKVSSLIHLLSFFVIRHHFRNIQKKQGTFKAIESRIKGLIKFIKNVEIDLAKGQFNGSLRTLDEVVDFSTPYFIPDIDRVFFSQNIYRAFEKNIVLAIKSEPKPIAPVIGRPDNDDESQHSNSNDINTSPSNDDAEYLPKKSERLLAGIKAQSDSEINTADGEVKETKTKTKLQLKCVASSLDSRETLKPSFRNFKRKPEYPLQLPGLNYALKSREKRILVAQLLEDLSGDDFSRETLTVLLAILTASTLTRLTSFVVTTTFNDEYINSICLKTGVWRRHSLEFEKSFNPDQEQLSWLAPHDDFLQLHLPWGIIDALKRQAAKLNISAEIISEGVPLYVLLGLDRPDLSDSINAYMNKLKLSFNYGSRQLTQKAMRYTLYAEIAQSVDASSASLLFATSEFSNPITLYYLSLSEKKLQEHYDQALRKLGFDNASVALCRDVFIGSRMPVNVDKFTARVKSKVDKLETLLDTPNENIEQVIQRHNDFACIVSLAFALSGALREQAGYFFDYATVSESGGYFLVCDKYHIGDNPTRLLPLPPLVASLLHECRLQLRVTAHALKEDYPQLATLLLSLYQPSRSGPYDQPHSQTGLPLLGLIVDGRWQNISSASINAFLGDDFALPGNFTRHLTCSHMPQPLIKYRQQLMGHNNQGHHVLDEMSMSLSWFDDESVLNAMDNMLQSLGFASLKAQSLRGAFSLERLLSKAVFYPQGFIERQKHSARAYLFANEWDIFVQNDFDGLGSHTVNCAGGPIDPIINEFSASTTGPDVEYIEVFGSPGTDYSAFTILEIEGDSNSPGSIDRIFVLGNTDGGGFWTTNFGTLNIENGSITLLLVEGFTGSVGYDIDSNDDGIIDGSAPWTRIVDDVAVYDGGLSDLSYSSVVLGPNYDGISGFAPGGASRIPNGTDTDTITDWVRNDFHLFGIPGNSGTLVIGEAENTPGAANISQTIIADPVGVCADVATPIHDIQGSGLVSPYVDSIREVEAVVTAVFQGNGYIGGYFVQEEDADTDADPSTSEGLRIFDTANTPAIGDLVRIRGSVTEFFELTQLNNITGFSVCGTGVALPTTTVLSLPVSNVEDFEAYEGMAVTFPQALVISEYFNFDRFNEIVLTSERHLTPTAEFEPGPDAIAAAADFLLDKITLDDGRSGQNSDPAIHPNGGDFNLTNLFRGGDTVANVTGVLDYSFGTYRIQPTQGADHVAVNLRSAEPELTGGNFKVASFNVLNYFNGDGFGGGFPTSRGADNLDEFTRQRDKIVAAMVTIDADVFGVMEIENDGYGSLSAIQDLVNGLNDATLPGTYSFVDPGIAKIGTDQIAVGFIFNQTKVAPHGSSAILDASVDPRFDDTKNRPALAQTFVATSTGAILTVAVNHLKSKGSNCNALGDPDMGDGAGNCNLTRASAAAALVDWLASDPTDSNDSDVLIIGDLNSYDKEEPIDVLIDGGYTDLAASFNGEAAYSYVFDGQIGYLDYALANPSLLSQVTGITEWHINADEPDLIDYDTNFKKDAQDAIYAPDAYRSSDHDPVMVGLELLNYGFTGFFRPIDNMPAINRIKAGRSVPVKFSLNSHYGLDILASGYPISQQIDCDSGSLLGESGETATAGSSSLSNEKGSGQYKYVWKTEKAWKDSCRQLSIKLIDGSTHTAHFQLK